MHSIKKKAFWKFHIQIAYIYTQLAVHCLNRDLILSHWIKRRLLGWPLRPPQACCRRPCAHSCLLTRTFFCSSRSAVHGKGEGRGAVAPPADRTEAGEAHGKSRHLEDIRPEDSRCVCFSDSLTRILLQCDSFHPLLRHVFTLITSDCLCFNISHLCSSGCAIFNN